MKEINTDILKCKWVLVTGCTSGIGWKLVEQLSQCNINVVCLGRSKQKLDEMHQAMLKKGYKSQYEFIVKDLGEIKSISELVNEWEQIFQNKPYIDLVINNAGISKKQPINQLQYNDFVSLQNINIFSPLIIGNTFLQQKQPTKKSLILCSSGLSYIPVGFSGFYPFDKHTSNQMMKCLNEIVDHKNTKLQTILLGQVFSGISQYSNEKWSPDNDSSSNLKFGFISSSDAAFSILFYAFGDQNLEAVGNPDHYLKFLLVREWNIWIISKIWRKKRIEYIKKNSHEHS